MIPDPDCQPGSDASYGFDVCDGDLGDDGKTAPTGSGYQGLISFVGKQGYKDPGCWISGSYNAADCPLGLGTSTGALGYRKFPNPKFDPTKWSGWASFNPNDGSQEPPYLIGTACGSCHIAFRPTDPPADPNHPQKHNIMGLIGNQFEYMEEIIASGTDPHSLEWQGYVTGHAGSVDTSAHPNDLIHNPATVNSIINLDKRPPGLPASNSPAFKDFDRVIADGNGKLTTQRVTNILKGGEDDVGGSGAILRVYMNEGLCSEPCWMNHLIDNRMIVGRNSQQTPFSQVQCRRDCPNYVAIERHYPDVIQFFVSPAGRPTDLKTALFPADDPKTAYNKLVAQLGADQIKLGRQVYAQNCAQCHSSLKAPDGQQQDDFLNGLPAQRKPPASTHSWQKTATACVTTGWAAKSASRLPRLGRSAAARCTRIISTDTVWDEFSSQTYKNSPTPPGIPELVGQVGGGRGYYRDVSLLSVWTQAPFLHNNAVGPELCNPRPSKDASGLYR